MIKEVQQSAYFKQARFNQPSKFLLVAYEKEAIRANAMQVELESVHNEVT